MQLNLIEQPASEIVTLGEAKNYLRIDHDFDDNLILNLIKSTREAIETTIQKSIVKQTWEYKLDRESVSNFKPGNSSYPNIFCGVMRIPLPKPPIMKIILVEIDDREIDPKKYSLETINERFCLCLNDPKLFQNKRKISVRIIYETGISEDPENIPYQLKLANLMLVANAFQERFSYPQNGFVSQGVKRLLSPFLNLGVC
ncbi:MAG: head-tail connector protein [Holosporaceae bacterium]|jgi:hypothetical protein|nr:head-tail connector protein [Holosporaceae bacterium]